jgi:hypothetical protein
MVKYVVLLLLAAMLSVSVTGCKAPSGSREYIPGKGWVPND